MLYEFTFRRFFDEAYSSDNFLKYDDKNSKSSFSSFIKSMSNDKGQTSGTDNYNTVLTTNLSSEDSVSKPVVGTSRSAIINDFLESTSQKMESEISQRKLAKEETMSGNSSLNTKNTANFLNIRSQNPAPDYFGKLTSSSSSSNNLNSKENRNDDQAPIFV